MKKSPLRTLAIVTLFTLGLNACGQRGALYLPEPPPPLPKPAGYDKPDQQQNR
ncbi:LPS translocon maturation chaperone LptM [Limnobacter thiooxidans]|uniref:LPS translocon maturation chaperone LptM n=1 Tax=Limnobacter thiooxidans TaxID=131080 RepID=UPI00102E0EED